MNESIAESKISIVKANESSRPKDAKTALNGLHAQPAGVENIEPDFGVTPPQGTLRPLAFKLAQHVLPLHHSQATPFHLGHEQSLAVVGVGRDQIQFDVAFPIPLRARKARPAHIFKHRCGVVVNELPLFLDRIDRIDACQTLCLPDITLPVLARRKEALNRQRATASSTKFNNQKEHAIGENNTAR